MKKLICLICFAFSFVLVEAQQEDFYMIDGQQLTLKKEVNGKLDLLWNIFDGKYRYFVQNESNKILELTNTKKDGKFQEEYKTLLNELTNGSMSTKRLNLTLFSLKEFIDNYNASVDPNYVSTAKRNKLMFRLGVFGGVTNSPFIINPDNLITPYFGGEFEVLDVDQISRHAAFFQIKHVLEQDDINYSTTELALGYRFRAINKAQFSLYANVKFATVNFTNAERLAFDTNGILMLEEFNETAFDVPFIFGVGADIRVTQNSFITLAYNELFALLIENQGNFSTDFTIGYKFNL